MFLQKPMLGTQLDHSDSLNNPVLDLLFNEGHGKRVNDLSGWGNHGTLHGFDFPSTRTSGWNPGMDGVCLNFDGSDDYINCGNNPILNCPGSIAIDVVMKPSNVTGNKGLVAKRDSNVKTPYTFFISDNKLRYTYYGIDETWYSTAYSSAGITTDWQRVTVSFNSATGLVQFYRNGIPFGSEIYASSPKSNDLPVLIGNDPGYGFFEGSIARARILPRSMSAFGVMQRQIDPYGVYQQ